MGASFTNCRKTKKKKSPDIIYEQTSLNQTNEANDVITPFPISVKQQMSTIMQNWIRKPSTNGVMGTCIPEHIVRMIVDQYTHRRIFDREQEAKLFPALELIDRPNSLPPYYKNMAWATELKRLLDYHFKVILLGERNVGKTSILFRLCGESFIDDVTRSGGPKFRTKLMNFDGKKIHLEIWDYPPGQEQYSTLQSIYYRGSHAVLLIYDVTDKRSLERINHWIEDMKRNISLSPNLILIANKLDLANLNHKNRTVSKEDGQQMADNLGIDTFIEVSAKTAWNVDLTEQFLVSRTIDMVHRAQMPWFG